MKLIDRYMLKQFLLTLLFSVLVLCVIFIIVNMIERLDKFIDAKMGTKEIATYYLYFLPEILKMLIPVAVLISGLFTVGRMSNINEITALKSGGVSLHRLMLPFVIVCTFISFGHLYFNGWLVPKANERKFLMEQKFLNRSSEASISNFYYRENPDVNILIGYYEPEYQIAHNAAIEYFTPSPQKRLKKRISAETMLWDSTKKIWKLQDVIIRNFDTNKITSERTPDMEIKLGAGGDQIRKIQKKSDQMTFPEIREYLNFLKHGGKDISRLETEYYANYAFPFANIIVIFFAIPFASVKKKNGLAVQIAAAMGVAFSYLVFWKVGQSVGAGLSLSPIISGWMANIIFIAVGLIVIIKTRT